MITIFPYSFQIETNDNKELKLSISDHNFKKCTVTLKILLLKYFYYLKHFPYRYFVVWLMSNR